MKQLQFLYTICLFAFTFAVGANSVSICVESYDPLSQDRPLLTEFRKVYTDAQLAQWNSANYGQVYADIDNTIDVKGVSFTKTLRPGDEFIDRRSGGIIRQNILKGLDYSLSLAEAKLPADALVLGVADPVVNGILFGVDDNNVPRGVAWAWNSIKYELDGEVYEIVYFYHGFYNINVGNHDYWDGEMHLVANKAARVATTCNLKEITYQVIRE
ncbi:MAG: hypothetical protein HQK83_03730 [Fibrobacteria bacterium]|nr:hypothetical protein [Fibrobacteria bacterium]